MQRREHEQGKRTKYDRNAKRYESKRDKNLLRKDIKKEEKPRRRGRSHESDDSSSINPEDKQEPVAVEIKEDPGNVSVHSEHDDDNII